MTQSIKLSIQKYIIRAIENKIFSSAVVGICDIEKETGLVILSNYTYPKRKKDPGLINEVRRSIADIIFTRNR